ncbi:MAG: NADH dehydrogenase subunit C [Chlorobi bacterium OLB7]|nr:MAG: NADH dehydrogenase subunit C [Chlorobi bacterium OLB7]
MTAAERLEQLKQALLPLLAEHFGEESFQTAEHRNELSIAIPREQLTELMGFLRDTESLRFNQLRDINAVDWNRRKDRFELIYNLYSLPNSWRLRVKCFTDEKTPPR